MQLTSFSVTGFRALADVGPVPMQRPTILTGRNDSGKSSLLDALAFLLDPSTKAKPTDFPLRANDPEDSGSADEEQLIYVTGDFELSSDEQEAMRLPDRVRVRRSARREAETIPPLLVYEVECQVPVNPLLRDLTESRGLRELQDIAAELGVERDGAANRKESYLSVLRPTAEAADKQLDWTPADETVLRGLPWFLHRTGVGAADVNGTLRDALKLLYREILDRDEFRDRVTGLQTEIASALTAESRSLCDTIERNCDGLTDVSLVPDVSFRDAVLTGTQAFAVRDGRKVGFEHTGTGRRQQVIHAIWEWQNQEIMRSAAQERPVIIAYDEPDVSLDYARQRSFMTLVREQCASGNVRAAVATHSVQMIDQVPLDNVVHLEQAGGATRLRQVPGNGGYDEVSTFIGELTEELGLSTSSVLFERCFLLVEGPSERKAFPRLFHIAQEVRLQEAGIVLFDGGGNTAVLKLVKCLREMGKPVYVIVDADSKRDHPRIFNESKLLEAGVPVGHIDYLGDTNELEELFTNQQWSDLGNKFWPHEDRAWESHHFARLRGTGKFSDEVKSMLRERSKPNLMARMAEMINHRDGIPTQLSEAFDRLMETLRNGQRG